ncbi:hypothetical protein BC6307_19195 [Sutcliffiella cohnii]|uniref:DNA 3'-5' helicase n=1 Tax=Sutcliffiella cohnii TaxID=33932 RepID=A0A223KUQ0_9BACI|nr:ATP-dependent helicase [Sutcliffiella cohnii]AST93231.1 hypothetical protein BC6307_19195 [Sutcliffiella cohnii]
MNKEDLVEKIIKIHESDQEQLDFVFSEQQKIIVTAPAGCGKTKSMISKIAYEILANKTMNFKKILALTFSVNAATKIKEDINEMLPVLLGRKEINVNNKLDVSNYHNFAFKLIQKHGYLLKEELLHIHSFSIIPENSRVLMEYLTSKEYGILNEYDSYLKDVKEKELEKLEEEYYRILIDKVIPNKLITFNGLLLIANKIFENKTIRSFYQKYYCMVIVDEFQDTNYLSYKLITNLFGENKIILMGDDIQKIYGFLGAIPGLFSKVSLEYGMKEMEFKTNYRFANNIEMKKLDNYIRGIIKNYDEIDSYEESADVKVKISDSQADEASFIVNHLTQKVTENESKVAVLVRAGYAANHVIVELEYQGIPYFNGLFSEQNPEYVRFHETASEIFQEESGNSKSVSNSVIEKVLSGIVNKRDEIMIDSDDIYIFDSLFRLLTLFLKSIKNKRLSRSEQYKKVVFVLGSNSLKHIMNEVEESIIVTTLHGSKGLEWDYVYMPEITAYTFPSSRSICTECGRREGRTVYPDACKFNFLSGLKSRFVEEISLFYVGITRAKKDVYLFSNVDFNRFGYTKKSSCMLSLPNLSLNKL